MSSTKPIFAFLLCRMKNGTVTKLRTHRVASDGETLVQLPLSPRQLAVMHRADRVTAPDVNGNASRQTERRHSA